MIVSSSWISRRRAFAPIAAAVASAAITGHAESSRPGSAPLPARYDEPLGIGLEGWPYPAPLQWQPVVVAGQSLRMAYMDVGPVAKKRYRTVVLLHGRNFDSSYWAGPIKDLTEAGFRVIVPDQIGFNKSSKPDIAYSFDLFADLTVNLLSGLQLEQVSIIGHSAGGMLAVRIAASFPNRVERLILESPIGLVDYRRFIPAQSIETLIAAEHRLSISAYRADLRRHCPSLSPKDLEPYVEWRMRVAQSGEFDRFCKAAALTQQMIYRQPVRDQYDAITARALMIIGEKDQTAPLIHYAAPEVAAKMPSIPQAAPIAVKEMAKGTLVVVPGVGHVPHLEAPEMFREKMLSFLLA